MNAGASDLAAASGLLADRARELAAQAATPDLATAVLATEVRALAGSVLRLAVQQAHASGRTWQEIGDGLGISPQAAFQRFGRPAGPEPGAPEPDTPVITDAAGRAIAVLADWFEERYDAVAATFDPVMAGKLPPAGLAAARGQLAGTAGRYRRLGDNDPLVRQLGDYTVADVPLEFEVGPMKGRVAFDRAGRVAGLYVLPAAMP
jgi:hypothetical protein